MACWPRRPGASPARRSATRARSAATPARTRAAGTTAPASTATVPAATPATRIRPQGMNREHCLFGAARCVAVSPSDTAPALTALDASIVVRNAKGERVVPAEKFFIGPAVDIRRMTVLEPGDILTAIRIPKTFAGARFYFEKVADRTTWDFALVNIAAAMHRRRRRDQGPARGLRGGRVRTAPAHRRGGTGARQRQERGNGQPRGYRRGARSGAAELQRLQDPADGNLVRRAIRDA